jgi:hypothetical protein
MNRELDMAGWLEDHATDASRTQLEPITEVLEPQVTVEAYDAFDALLERTYRLLNRPALHSHHCKRCSMLRPCLQQPCHFRALDCEDQWICGDCVAGEEPL